MKKTTTGLLATLTVLGLTLLLGVGPAAAACVERDAYVDVVTQKPVTDTVYHEAVTETVHHDAVTESVIDQEAYDETVVVVDKEAYDETVTVVDEEAWTEEIFHPEVSHIVHHDAVTHEECKTKFQYQKQVKGKVEKEPKKGSQWIPVGSFGYEFWTSANGWNTAGSFKWSTSDVAVLESGSHNATSEATGPKGDRTRKHSTNYQYVKNGVTEKFDCKVVVDREAYDEKVVDSEAYTETVEHPAVTHDEVVHHEAVTHEETVHHEATYKDVVVTEAYNEEVVVTEAYEETVVVKEGSRDRVRHAARTCATPPSNPDLPNLPNTGGPNALSTTILVALGLSLIGFGLWYVIGGLSRRK